MKRIWLFFLFALLCASLVACSSVPQRSAPTNPPEMLAEKPFTLDQLIPTDPATVELAAGKVQLVEFFAFW